MPELKIKPAFALGDIVYLKSCAAQWERMVTGIIVTPTGLLYQLRYSDEDCTTHSVIEISKDRDEAKLKDSDE